MKKTKLFAVIMTTFALLLGAGTSVLAEGTENMPTVDITKVYKLLNEGTSAPEETFTFKVEKEKVENSSVTTTDGMPMLQFNSSDVGEDGVKISYNTTDGTATVEGNSKKVNLTFPVTADTRPGQYTYKITETAGNTPGVEYDSKTVYAKVTVLNGDNGVYVDSVTYTVEDGKLGDGEGFHNIYKAVKELTIEKTVTGNLGDKSKYFAVDVTLSGGTDGQSFNTNGKDLSYTGSSGDTNPTTIISGTAATFYLKDGETIKITNVPYGLTYTVKEQDYTSIASGGYDLAKYTLNGTSTGTTSITNEAVDSATEAVQIINNKGTQIDTGVVLDNLPYIILLGIVIGAAVVWFLRRRLNADRD